MGTTNISFNRFQRGWRILVIFTAAFCIASLIWSITTTPIYRASAKFLVYPNENLTSSRDIVSSMDTLDRRTTTTTYADILESNRVFQDTIDRLKLDPSDLENIKVYSEVQTDTNILVLHVEGPDPQVITLLANNIGQNGISLIKSIYQVFDVSFLDLAVEPETPFRPNPLVDGLIAAGIGLVVGLLFIVLQGSLRVPLEALRVRSLTDKQSLAYTKKYMVRTLAQELTKKKDAPFAYGLIYLQGLEDLIEGLPERITTVVMQNVVQRLHILLRGNDLVARWDRLVFSVLLPSTPEMPAVKTFGRLLQALEEPLEIEGGDVISLTPLVGLGISKPEDTGDQITQRGEDALNKARAGEDKIVVAK
jgi:capsular polysaccharide biosynthesis protein/GGDEF domain-containing protein